MNKNRITAFSGLMAGVVMGGGLMFAAGPHKTPQSCIDALASADSGFTMAGAAVSSASKLDVYGITYYTGQINELAPTYNEQKAACRGEGK